MLQQGLQKWFRGQDLQSFKENMSEPQYLSFLSDFDRRGNRLSILIHEDEAVTPRCYHCLWETVITAFGRFYVLPQDQEVSALTERQLQCCVSEKDATPLVLVKKNGFR